MRSIVSFVVAFGACVVLFLMLDVVLFNMQGLSFWFKG